MHRLNGTVISPFGYFLKVSRNDQRQGWAIVFLPILVKNVNSGWIWVQAFFTDIPNRFKIVFFSTYPVIPILQTRQKQYFLLFHHCEIVKKKKHISYLFIYLSGSLETVVSAQSVDVDHLFWLFSFIIGLTGSAIISQLVWLVYGVYNFTWRPVKYENGKRERIDRTSPGGLS